MPFNLQPPHEGTPAWSSQYAGYGWHPFQEGMRGLENEFVRRMGRLPTPEEYNAIAQDPSRLPLPAAESTWSPGNNDIRELALEYQRRTGRVPGYFELRNIYSDPSRMPGATAASTPTPPVPETTATMDNADIPFRHQRSMRTKGRPAQEGMPAVEGTEAEVDHEPSVFRDRQSPASVLSGPQDPSFTSSSEQIEDSDVGIGRHETKSQFDADSKSADILAFYKYTGRMPNFHEKQYMRMMGEIPPEVKARRILNTDKKEESRELPAFLTQGNMEAAFGPKYMQEQQRSLIEASNIEANKGYVPSDLSTDMGQASLELGKQRVAPKSEQTREAEEALGSQGITSDEARRRFEEFEGRARQHADHFSYLDAVPHLDKATEDISEAMEKYRNKNEEDVIQALRKSSEKHFVEKILPRIRNKYDSPGVLYHGAASRDTDDAVKEYLENVYLQEAKLRFQGEEQAYDRALKEQEKQQRLGTSKAGLIGEDLRRQLAATNLMQEIEAKRLSELLKHSAFKQSFGKEDEARAQAVLDQAIKDLLESREHRKKQLAYAMGIFKGLPETARMAYRINQEAPTVGTSPYSSAGGILGAIGRNMFGYKKGGQVQAYAQGGAVTPAEAVNESFLEGVPPKEMMQRLNRRKIMLDMLGRQNLKKGESVSSLKTQALESYDPILKGAEKGERFIDRQELIDRHKELSKVIPMREKSQLGSILDDIAASLAITNKGKALGHFGESVLNASKGLTEREKSRWEDQERQRASDLAQLDFEREIDKEAFDEDRKNRADKLEIEKMALEEAKAEAMRLYHEETNDMHKQQIAQQARLIDAQIEKINSEMRGGMNRVFDSRLMKPDERKALAEAKNNLSASSSIKHLLDKIRDIVLSPDFDPGVIMGTASLLGGYGPAVAAPFNSKARSEITKFAAAKNALITELRAAMGRGVPLAQGFVQLMEKSKLNEFQDKDTMLGILLDYYNYVLGKEEQSKDTLETLGMPQEMVDQYIEKAHSLPERAREMSGISLQNKRSIEDKIKEKERNIEILRNQKKLQNVTSSELAGI